MEALRRLLIALGINAVPIIGFAAAGWSEATAISVYWFENLFGSLLIAARISLHERWTRKRGHYRAHLQTEARINGRVKRSVTAISFSREFLLSSLIFTLAHGVFLGFLLIMLDAPIEPAALAAGAALVVVIELINFGIDLIGLKDRPFAWVKQKAQLALGRVGLVHIAIIFGMIAAGLLSDNRLFFLPFAALKLLADLANILPRGNPDAPPPRWLVSTMDRVRPGHDFAAFWAADRASEVREAALDEEIQRT